MSKKLKPIVALVMVLGLFGGILPGPAVAQIDTPKFSDLLVVTGTADIDPPGPAGAVYWLGGSGTYTFDSSVAGSCDYLSNPAPGGPELPGTCPAFISPGTFVNFVCGTGMAMGTATILEGAAAGEPGQTNTINYGIVFVGAQGILLADVLEDITVMGGYPAQAVGIVHLSAIPSPPDPTMDKWGVCTPSFTISAVAVVFETLLQP